MHSASPALNRIDSRKKIKQMSQNSDQALKNPSDNSASAAEAQAEQAQLVPPTIDADAADHVKVAPGTGGPDDPGDVDTDDSDINLPPYGETEPPD